MGWMYALLDLPTGIAMIRKNLADLDFFPSFFLLLTFGALLFPLSWFLWTFDLGATWEWTTPWRASMLDSTSSVIADAGFFAAMLAWIFNLTPTMMELSFPKVARGIPAIALALKVSIIFDFVTDWPKMWQTMQDIAWFSQFHPSLAFLFRLIATMIGTLFVSMGLQVIVALLLMACLFLFLNMGSQAERGKVIKGVIEG